MIIRCESCGTRYNLAEEKLKPGGTRVRCARCSSVFVVFPSSSEDLPELEICSDDFGPGGEADESPAPSRERAGGGPETSPAEQPSAPSRRMPSAAPSPFDPDDFSLGDGSVPSPASLRREASPPESDFDLSAAADNPAAGNGKPGAAAPENGVEDEDFSPPPSLPSFDGETGISDPFHHEPPKKGFSLAGRLLLVVILMVAAVGGGLAGFFFWSGGALDLGRLLERFRGAPAVQPAQPEGRIHLDRIEGFFVVNRDAGRLFVIRGEAVNGFSEPRGAISVKGVLYDTTGKPIAQRIAFCGNPLTDEALRTLPLRKLEEAMKNQFGADFSNLTTAPGRTIPFTLVFQNVPDKLAEFSVDANASLPTSNDR